MVLPAYALEFSPTNFLEQLFELLLTVGNREFYFEQFEICEYGELPSACPHELLVFQLVVRATEFPRGEWIHIFCNDRFQILGIRFELD
ncbi:putative transcriptional regulator [Herpetosiphon aurantiacus DSM 785]|uniref:Transcriptional regulator n=2 Tax=Herpetosiphon TaxID=64 RepID=A9AYN1_HERA2|nr:putative transcriptional regulator [Herpetosiphon aurantiacus DSM 785]